MFESASKNDNKPGPTRTAEVLSSLRRDIVEARLRPGDKLRFEELRATYGSGIPPLREALMHLASEGLVIAEERKGYRVAPVSNEDLLEIARLRGEFDSLAIRESIKNGNEIWEGRVIAAFHALSKRSKLDSNGEVDPEWEPYHIRFHYELGSESRLPKLQSFKEILDLQAQRYRRIAVHYLTAPRDDLEEHRAIMDAVLGRDERLATKLIKRHYLTTVEIILSGSDLS